MRRLLTFLQTLYQVIDWELTPSIPTRYFLIGAIDDLMLSKQQQTATGASGPIAQPGSLSRCLSERIELARSRKYPRRIER